MEQLNGKPSYKIVTPIIEGHYGIENFFAAGARMSGYDNDHRDIRSLSVAGAESANWPRNFRRRVNCDYVTLLSQVLMRETFLHIPMADFDLKGMSKDDGLEHVQMLLKLLSLPNGVLAFSGNGFHYMSPHLVEHAGFQRMIEGIGDEAGNFPVVDRIWLRNTTRSGFGQLRVTAGAEKKVEPRITAFHILDPLDRQDSDQKFHVWRPEY